MATIDDLLFAITWLECYDVGEDDEKNAKAKERAIDFLKKEVIKRHNRKGKK